MGYFSDLFLHLEMETVNALSWRCDMKLWGVHCELGAQCLEGTRCVLVEGKEEILI